MTSAAAPLPLQIEVAQLPDADVVKVGGELDVHTYERLPQAVETLDDPRALLVLDLSEVSFMDSSGVRALVIARRLCREREATLVLAGLTSQVTKLLKIVQLERLIPVYDTTRLALAHRD